MSSIFNLLPTELWILIKQSIPQSDLRTHVCFFNSCPELASLYGSEEDQEVFFEGACILSGLGCLPGESPYKVSWRKIAFECIELDGFCGHPECGGARLEANAKAMEREILNIPRWDALSIQKQNDETRFEVNPLLRHIKFHESLQNLDVSNTDALLQFPVTKNQQGRSEPLHLHPIACRSFAAFPLTRSFRFLRPDLEFAACNAKGVTVWDVQEILQRTLDEPLSVEGLANLVGSSGPTETISTGGDLAEVLRSNRNLRGFLSDFNINGIEYVESDSDGPMFSCIFQATQNSPANKERTVSSEVAAMSSTSLSGFFHIHPIELLSSLWKSFFSRIL